MNKQDVLDNLDQVKKYVSEIEEDKNKKETKKINIQIKNRFTGLIIFESEKTTWKEAVEEAKNSEADLCGADLSEADLSGADLSEADLSGADLCEADLCGADLSGADLSGADLCRANLSGADLCRANLCGANLSRANLSEADLCDAELCNAKFYGKGGQKELKKSQLPDFLTALGFKIVD
jgi:uncharacterized protein YjbI with pentapeptide repeats